MPPLLFNLKTSFFRLYEWLKVAVYYYRINGLFIMIDLLMAYNYLLKSPHRISKAFLKRRGERDIYAYGETPLTTLDYIATESGILSHDILYELGCGSGRSCFWLNLFINCRVTGIDYLPTFIEKANTIKKKMGLNGITFLQQDMMESDLESATVIYLYGTCLPDETIRQLIKKFETLRVGTKLITVSYPLADFIELPLFRVEKSFKAPFPWGQADVFINIRI